MRRGLARPDAWRRLLSPLLASRRRCDRCGLSRCFEATGHTIYNASGTDEVSNIEILRMIARRIGVPEEKAFISVEDRAGQDLRYGMDNSRIAALGWTQKTAV